MYIGELKIKGTKKLENGLVEVSFKNHSSIELKQELLDIIQSEEKHSGEATDVIVHILSTKYLSELSDLGLDFMMVDFIGTGMKTLAHNLREEAIGKAFGCNGALDIKLEKLIS